MTDHIVHFSDIHIKPEARHTEVIEAVEYMLKNVPSNSLFVLAGDVFQSKEKVTPSMIWTCREVFELITTSGDLVVINGNHDIYERRRDRIPLLRCITRGMSRVHYIETSQSMTLTTTTGKVFGLGISSLLDDGIFPASETPGDIKIAIAHVLLKEAGGSGNELRGAKCSDFEEYDVALLGDIHEHTIISNCIYSGSLIRHTHGETDYKGFGVYNIIENSYEFVQVPSRYGMVTIPVTRDGFIHLPPDLPEVSYVRLEIPPDMRDKVPAIKTMIAERTKIAEFTVSLPGLRGDDGRGSVSGGASPDVPSSPPPSWASIFPDLIPPEYEGIKEDLKVLHSSCSMSVAESREVKRWKLISIDIQNMFSFCDSMVHTFTFGKGIVRISGDNASGKTSILKSIIFSVFGTLDIHCSTEGAEGEQCKTERGAKKASGPSLCINTSTHQGFTKVNLQVNGTSYQIVREQKRIAQRTSNTVKLEMWQDDHWVNMGVGLCKRETETEIRKLLGISSLFMYGNVYSNGLGTSIAPLSPGDKYKLFFNTLALGVFSSLRDLAKTEERKATDAVDVLVSEKKSIETKLACIPLTSPAPADLSARLSKLDVFADERKSIEAEIEGMRLEIDIIRSSLPVTKIHTHAPPGPDLSHEQEKVVAMAAEAKRICHTLKDYPAIPGIEPYECSEEEGLALTEMLDTARHVLKDHGWLHEDEEKARRALLSLDDVPIWYGAVPSTKEMAEARRVIVRTEGVMPPHHATEELVRYLSEWKVSWNPSVPFIPVLRSSYPRSTPSPLTDLEWMRYDSTIGKDPGISFPSFFALPAERPSGTISQDEIRRVLDIIYDLGTNQSLISKLGTVCASHRDQTLNNEIYEWINHVMTSLARAHFKKFVEEGEKMIRGAEKRRYTSVVHYHSLLRSQAGRRVAMERSLIELEQKRALVGEWIDYKLFLTTVVSREEMREKGQMVAKKQEELKGVIAKQLELAEKIGRAKSAKEAHEAMLATRGVLYERLGKISAELDIAEHRQRVARTYLSLVEPKQAFVQSIISGWLKRFETLINETIHPYVKYIVQLRVSDKGGIEVDVHLGDALVTLAHLSGFELFMFEVSIKLCLNAFSLSSHCSLFMIDEGLDVIDGRMIDSLHGLFDQLRGGNVPVFDDILLITHRDGVDQYCHEVVPIASV